MWEKVKKLFAPSDMTVGTPWKKIVAFMIPMLIGNIAQQMYNTVDSIVVGRYVGDNALAAVGSAGPIFQLLLVLFAGIAVGAGIMVSQYFGAKARDELSETIGCCITLTILASLALMILSPFIVRPLLELLDTPGILWPKFEDQTVGLRLALIGSIKDEVLQTEELAAELIRFLAANYPGVLENKYTITAAPDPYVMLGRIAESRHCLVRGNELDTEKAAMLLMDDFREGKLGRLTLEYPQTEEA